jgi:hypothetical protein
MSGSTLHVAWAKSAGAHTVLAYIRSTNGGATWSSPKVIGGLAGDQFFPWIAAQGAKVEASWFYRSGEGNVYVADGAAFSNGGASWSAPFGISTANSDANAGNFFGFPNCAASFVGDYSGITIGSTASATRCGPTSVPTTSRAISAAPTRIRYTATLTLP